MSEKLSERMAAVANLVTPGSRVADVGCDHAYIPIALCRTGTIPSAIAMDVEQGPLKRAREHIEASGMDERICVRRSDGLEKLGCGEADTVLIAGMGGLLMVRILTEREIPAGVTELVLQPQSDIAGVRVCVRKIGFHIVDENMVLEDGKFYPMMKAQKGSVPRGEEMAADAGQQEVEDAFGPVLLARRDPVLYKWLKKERAVADGILERLDGEMEASSDAERIRLRREEIAHQKELIQMALEYYQ